MQPEAPQPFDVVFDNTFRATVLITPGSPPNRCTQKGVYLTWLSLKGWCYWLFEGAITTDREVNDLGTPIEQAGIEVASQKSYGPVLTIRTANLSESYSSYVATVYDSVAVYMVLMDANNWVYYLPVRVDPGTFPIWESKQKRGILEVKIKLPKQRSQRT